MGQSANPTFPPRHASSADAIDPHMSYDAHCHLDFPAFDQDRQAVCDEARAAGITGWLIAGADPEHWERARAVAQSTGAQLALGIHPWYANAETLPRDLERLAIAPVDAIGECGLDFLRNPSPSQRDTQRAVLSAQVAVARQRDLPVVLHLVRATSEALILLKREGLPAAGGMIHRWSGKAPQVQSALSLGLHLSFGPELLRPTATSLHESLRRVPLDRLLLETDCPELPLEGSERGVPRDVLRVAEAAARIRREPVEAILEASRHNAHALLRVAPTR